MKVSETPLDASVASFYFFAAFYAAQRFFRAATMLARPSALSLRWALFAGYGDPPFFSAQRLRCASAMAFLPAALMVRRGLARVVEKALPPYASRGGRKSAHRSVAFGPRSLQWQHR